MLEKSVNVKTSHSSPMLGGKGTYIHRLHREFITPTLDLTPVAAVKQTLHRLGRGETAEASV